MWKSLRDRIKGPITKLGVILTFLAFVSRWVGAGRLWLSILQWFWQRIAWLTTEWGNLCVLVIGIGLIAYDQYRRSYPKPYDLGTLRGRTLKLRDNIQAFLDGIPPIQDKLQQESQRDYMRRAVSEASRKTYKLLHGYEFRFASNVASICHEFGERGVTDMQLLIAIGKDRQDEEGYRTIIAALSHLAETEEAVGQRKIDSF